MNANREPAVIPDLMFGSVIDMNALKGLAPRLRAASTCPRGTLMIAPRKISAQ